MFTRVPSAAVLLVSSLLLFMFPLRSSGQEVSIRTNLLWDAAAEPNLGVEFAVGDHWSVGANAGLKSWPRWLFWDNDQNRTDHWRNFAVVPEVRYYLDEVYKGFFAGADFVYTHYNVGNVKFPLGLYPETQDYRLQGSFWGGGLFAGYAWWPWQHWRLELEAGVAAGLAAYSRYDCAHCGSKLGDETKPALVPKLGLNVAYNPVARDKRPVRNAVVVSGTDTLTVLTPPVAFVVQVKEVAAPETEGDRLGKKNSWVIPIEKYRPFDYLSRPGKDSLQYVVFPLGSAELDKGLGNNAAVLETLKQAVETIRDGERTSELLISIAGLASIEGPQELNDSLSVRRARAVANYLNAETFVGKRHMEVIGKGEAWDWFTAQVKAGPEGFSEEEINKLNEILSLDNPDEREKKLKTQPGLYAKVKDSLLGDQRNSGYIRVYYGSAPDAATEKLNGEIMELVKAKRYRDAVRAIEADAAVKARVNADAEAMNAYGIALYFTALDDKDAAREAEALGLLEKAAKMGSECAVQNLKGTEIYGPARKEFEAWQEAMKEK